MKTATIEVKYVNPVKEGKQYGSIKGVNNDSWPVKADRIREFEPGNIYELAYTETEKGFRNIIGVKRIVPQVEPQQHNGAPPATPQTKPQVAPPANGYYQPRPTAPKDSERMWTCAVLGHIIDRGGVDLNEEALIHAVNTLRTVYQKTYGLDDKPVVSSIPGEFKRVEVVKPQQEALPLPVNDDLYSYVEVPINILTAG
jgi:hypothetical protein